MPEIKVMTILYCAKCSALFESSSPDEYQSCPRCSSESIRTATVDRPTDYEAANLACAHVHTAAWKINPQGYLYCSVCRKAEGRMNNNLTPLSLLLKNESFRFDPQSCRSANVTLLEAKFLRWLFLAERSNVDVIQYFGLGFAYKLLKQGFVDNPLGVQDTAQTNIWKLTQDGLEILKILTGVKL